MERLTYRDEHGRARLTNYGARMYCSTQATADCFCELEEALAQKTVARVMTTDEVGTWVMIDRVDRAPIVVEVRNRFIAWVVGDEYYDLPECESLNLSSEFYNKTWRCWSSWPTTGQMEAVKWE